MLLVLLVQPWPLAVVVLDPAVSLHLLLLLLLRRHLLQLLVVVVGAAVELVVVFAVVGRGTGVGKPRRSGVVWA